MSENVPDVQIQSQPENESSTIQTSERSTAKAMVVPKKSQAKTRKTKKKRSKRSSGNIVWITGSRKWKKAGPIRRVLNKFKPIDVEFVVTGQRKGAEQIAQRVARSLGFNLIIVPANTLRFGDSAEAIRDDKIVGWFKPTQLLAFYEKMDEESGRFHSEWPRSVRLAKKKDIEFQVIKK